jgi:hypothetical protein
VDSTLLSWKAYNLGHYSRDNGVLNHRKRDLEKNPAYLSQHDRLLPLRFLFDAPAGFH